MQGRASFTVNIHPVIPAQARIHNALDKTYFVYLLSIGRYGTLYTGVTSDLIKRASQHRESLAEGFRKKYDVKPLVWYKVHNDVDAAIKREKQIKKWNRSWKIRLIQSQNPRWRELYEDIVR